MKLEKLFIEWADLVEKYDTHIPLRYCGICANFGKYVNLFTYVTPDELNEFVANYASTWEKFSGEYDYPIAVSSSPKDDYLTYSENKWDQTTLYGALRYELVRHIKECCEARL